MTRILFSAAIFFLAATVANAGFGHHKQQVCIGCVPVAYYQVAPVPVVRQQIIWEPRVIQVPGVMVPRAYPTPLRGFLFGREQFIPTAPTAPLSEPVPSAGPSVLAPTE